VRRNRLPISVEQKVLVRSTRRCCLCVFLDRRDEVTKGQIAHLNQNRNDHRLANLVWLCLDHHDDYDSRTSQSKGFTAAEVKAYRDRLYARDDLDNERRALSRSLKCEMRPPPASKSDPPKSLTTRPFVSSKPRWLTESKRQRLSDIARAAFVLFLFERTERGCWGKSYLPSKLPRIPLSQGAITGTPFALIAISSFTERGKAEKEVLNRAELLIHESNQSKVFTTLDWLLEQDGQYLKDVDPGYAKDQKLYEAPGHEAGACLIRMLYQALDARDLKTIERRCGPITNPVTYDFAVVSRLLFQVPYVDQISETLQMIVADARDALLQKLVFAIESVGGADIAGKSRMRHDAINQFSTTWYVLPLLSLDDDEIAPAVRAILIRRMRQFFSARAASVSESSLLPTVVELGIGHGKSSFGTGMALLAWRTLEQLVPDDKTLLMQVQQTVNRLIYSPVDTILTPAMYPAVDKPEGYLGWGAVCLGAASVGIQITYDDCAMAIAVTEELNKEKVTRSERELKTAYLRAIKKSKLIAPDLIEHVVSAAVTVARYYEPVKRFQSRLNRTGNSPMLQTRRGLKRR